MTWRAYQIKGDASHLVDRSYDIDFLRWPGSEHVPLWSKDALSLPPPPLAFVANFPAVRESDFPVTASPRPLQMSKRMLGVLLDAGQFDHRAHPVVLLDDVEIGKVPWNEPHLTLRKLLPKSAIDDERFVFVQLTSYVDGFDWEKSIFEPDDEAPGEVTSITRLVLRDVPFPPLFRLSAYPYRVFASPAGREAVIRAGLRGVVFNPYWLGWQRPDGE